ncbi:MAG TPA: hypothetical protein PL033_04235 [Candidatus Brocadiia bacterium]|nr:hypothetical protein [Candidatus Brocadiia bacterium]
MKKTVLGTDVKRVLRSAKARVLSEPGGTPEAELSASALFEEILLDKQGGSLLQEAGLDMEKVRGELRERPVREPARGLNPRSVPLDEKLIWIFNVEVPKLTRETTVRGCRIKKIGLEELIAGLLTCDDSRIGQLIAKAGLTSEKAAELSRALRGRAKVRPCGDHLPAKGATRRGPAPRPAKLESYTAYLWERAKTFQMRRKAVEKRLGPFNYGADFVMGDYVAQDYPLMNEILQMETGIEEQRNASAWWEACPLNSLFQTYTLSQVQCEVIECLLAHDVFGVGPALIEPLTVKDVCKILSPWGYPRNRRAVEIGIRELEETDTIILEPLSDGATSIPISCAWVYLPDEVLNELVPHGESLPIDEADRQLLDRQLDAREQPPSDGRRRQ